MKQRAKLVPFEWDYHNLDKLRNAKLISKPGEPAVYEPMRNIEPADVARLFSRNDIEYQSFREAAAVAGGLPPEERLFCVGYEEFEATVAEAERYPKSRENRVLVVVFTIRNGKVRVISARQARGKLLREYLPARNSSPTNS
jgi:hypothetical protein